nr:hypothetical protein [Candidatus Sigynarchaeota archaeon]
MNTRRDEIQGSDMQRIKAAYFPHAPRLRIDEAHYNKKYYHKQRLN